MATKYLRLATNISPLFKTNNNKKLAVAVSGGSDSLSLCLMLHFLSSELNFSLVSLTVDHKLRMESSKEAEQVKAIMQRFGIEHHILTWEGNKPTSNIQELARNARYKLLTDFCLKNDIPILMTGHQQNDQAENFIIRAEHGSGVYGLAGIPPLSTINNIQIVRPILNFAKEELQDFLQDLNIKWIEDSSNNNPKFARTAARRLLKKYPKWIPKLSAISNNLRQTKECIEYYLHKTLQELVNSDSHSDEFDLNKFNSLPQEMRFRMISHLLQNRSKKEKPARAERIENLLEKLQRGMSFSAATLSHCLIKRKKNKIVITKEIKLSGLL